MKYFSTKIIDLGSCAFRQWRADHSHCHFIHGYKLQAKFWFACTTLDDKNWVVDFGGLKDLKNALEQQFDHTLCVAADDPLLSYFKQLHDLGGCDLRIMDGGVGIEKTAEWCFNTANNLITKQTNNRCWVDKVEVWEHDKNSAIVTNTTCCNSKNVKEQDINIEETLHTTVAAPSPEIIKAVNESNKPAPIGNKVSSGYSNLFGGTSWGK